MTNSPKPVSRSAQVLTSTSLRIASFALVFLTIIALAALTYFTERGIVVKRDWVIHSYQVRSQLSELQLEIMQAKASETDYLLLQETKDLPLAKEETELAAQTVNSLRKLTKDNPQQVQRLNVLGQMLQVNSALIENRRGSRGITVQLSPAERQREQELGLRDQQIEAVVKRMLDEEESLLAQRLKDWDYLFKRNVLMLLLAFAVVALMLVYNSRALLLELARTKDTEKRVRDNAESYRQMSARILELQDLERRRIARELHDSVGQYLAGLKINLNQLESDSRIDEPKIDRPKMIRETIALTDYAIQEVRTISHLLHPPLLEELGFLPAARWYVDEYGKRSQVKVSLWVGESIERLPREVEIALFRVLQESLTNVYRHASAQSVDVRILCNDGHVSLTVADDGKGIPHDVLAKFRDGAASGIGLAGMRERLAEFGGQINVESSSGGAVVQAVIPTKAWTPRIQGSAPTL